MTRRPIETALAAFICGLAAVMALFTLLDLGSGDRSTALSIGMIAWPVVSITAGIIATRLNRDKSGENET